MISAVLAASLAAAQDRTSDGLAIDSSAEQIVVETDARGVAYRRLRRASIVHPGDELIYTIRFTNTTDKAIERAVIVKAIPREMSYVEGSAVGPAASVSFSIDGGESWGDPDEMKITDPDGASRPAGASDVTHVRWQLGYALSSGSSGFLRFRARMR